jgi:S-formylglutathione hydrolase FrmB
MTPAGATVERERSGSCVRRSVALLVAVITALIGLTAAQPARASELVEIEVTSRHVDILEEPGGGRPGRPPTLHANVMLPDGYDRHNRRGYPVLYLLHGADGYYRTWDEQVQALDVMQGFPGIIVMPDGGAFGMYTDWYNRGAFGRPGWMSYHLIDLRRAIQRRFRIRSGRRWHAIAGVSMGGMGAIRYAAAAPSYFGSAAAFSGASLDIQADETVAVFPATGVAIGEGATYDDVWGPPDGYYATANNPQQLIPNLQGTRVYITSGDGTPCPEDPPPSAQDAVLEMGLRRQADAYVAAARAAGVDITGAHTCGAHTNPTARRGLIAAIEWGFFAPVPKRLRSWTYITASPRGRAHGLRFRFAAQPTSVVRFERDGRVLRGEGDGTVRILRGSRCELELELPFETALPSDCERSKSR